jgi:hypothetical protein
MNITKSNRIKKLAVGATMTLVFGGGAVAVLPPTFASAAVATQGADDPAGHIRHGADDLIGHTAPSTAATPQSADDPIGHH